MLTAEQLEARRSTIGASDAGPILGLSPLKSAMQVWQEKVEGKVQYVNAGMDRGNRLESEARDLFIQMTNVYMGECQTFIHPERSWQTATPDGLSLMKDAVLEIKCNNKELHEQAKRKIIPVYYMAQIQHQMSVLGVDQGFYFSYNNDGAVVEVQRDQSFIDEMIEKEFAFWKLVMDKIPPEDAKALKKIFVEEFKDLCDEYSMIQELEDANKARKDQIKKRLEEISDGEQAEGFGYKFTQVKGRPIVNYKEIPQLIGVDLSKFSKIGKPSWRIISSSS